MPDVFFDILKICYYLKKLSKKRVEKNQNGKARGLRWIVLVRNRISNDYVIFFFLLILMSE